MSKESKEMEMMQQMLTQLSKAQSDLTDSQKQLMESMTANEDLAVASKEYESQVKVLTAEVSRLKEALAAAATTTGPGSTAEVEAEIRRLKDEVTRLMSDQNGITASRDAAIAEVARLKDALATATATATAAVPPPRLLLFLPSPFRLPLPLWKT